MCRPPLSCATISHCGIYTAPHRHTDTQPNTRQVLVRCSDWTVNCPRGHCTAQLFMQQNIIAKSRRCTLDDETQILNKQSGNEHTKRTCEDAGRARLQKRVSFLSAFPMFAPSLSWQNDGLLSAKWRNRYAFVLPRRRPGPSH